MATKYCPAKGAPPPAVLKESYPTNYESPQLGTMKYRQGGYTPGKDSTYAKRNGAKRDARSNGGNL